ncbi:alpha,alpha-trehalase TreF [Spirosoma aerophilum]
MANSPFPKSPDQLFGSLFRDVQLGHIFADSKTFVDCVPMQSPAEVVARYEAEKHSPDFDLTRFVHSSFTVPEKMAGGYVSDTSVSTVEHINGLWDRLTRQADTPVEGSSRVPLTHPYVVPGGRFREIFYWDTYFTMLGLKEAGRVDLIEDMLENFAYLIDQFGFIPNGNRTYFLSRSQPPYFALMVSLRAEISETLPDGTDVLIKYTPQLQREYDFWMQGQRDLTAETPIVRRVAKAPDNRIVNRHWDDTPAPRPEAYRQEVELMEASRSLGVVPEELYSHIRAACESGWDFSSRWFSDRHTMATIQTADIAPVDLNCLLHFLELTLQKAYAHAGQTDQATEFGQAASVRKEHIEALFWNEEAGFYYDYNLVTNQQIAVPTLAGAFPLFFQLATPEQAARVHNQLKTDFLHIGGWVTTLDKTGQQWDWPNGWAPLQWIVYRGLMDYGFTETARKGRDAWMDLNDKVFRATGKMMEKYNVVDAALTTGGGEYPNQDGFGWTNGVYLAMEKGR